ncbi:MAG: pyridoxal phosphate-dependent aminotransferase [Dehalococcoidia bacterium]|nr:MAG: pyridoxal phosphate-dependent aminotransferase [Dehalococcoidia bacterium]
MEYDFNNIIDRHNTNSIKWDFVEEFFEVTDILPMWVADMDFRLPKSIIDAVRKVAEHGIYGYTGIPTSYYDVLIKWVKSHHNLDLKKEWITFTPGGVTALHMLVKAFTRPGDQVVVQTPVYYPFFGAIKSGQCELLDNPLKFTGERYFMDLDDLKSKINSRTKMIILCNPHNPIGRVWRKDELKDIGELCLKNGILVVADEIHQDIVFKGFKHTPYASISGTFVDRSITIAGISKTFNLAGLQFSNIIIPNVSLRKRFMKIVEGCGVFLPNIFSIAATEAAYRFGDPWLEQLLAYLQENLVFLNKFIQENIPGLKIIQPEGTYLVWLDFTGCGIDPAKLKTFLFEKAKVALEAGVKFGPNGEGFARMNIACPRKILAEGLCRIERAVRRGV